MSTDPRDDAKAYQGMPWEEAVEKAIVEGRSEELLRAALGAMWSVHSTRFDAKDDRLVGPDTYYAGVMSMRTALSDAVDPRAIASTRARARDQDRDPDTEPLGSDGLSEVQRDGWSSTTDTHSDDTKAIEDAASRLARYVRAHVGTPTEAVLALHEVCMASGLPRRVVYLGYRLALERDLIRVRGHNKRISLGRGYYTAERAGAFDD